MKEETIETYIQKFPENIQEILKRVREIILSCNTELEETIKYGIPTFILHGNLVHFAAYKKHLGFYPDPSGVEAFKDKLEGYTISSYLRNSSSTFANPHYVTFVNHFSFHSVNNMYMACYQSCISLKVKYTHFLLAQVVMLQFIFPQI